MSAPSPFTGVSLPPADNLRSRAASRLTTDARHCIQHLVKSLRYLLLAWTLGLLVPVMADPAPDEEWAVRLAPGTDPHAVAKAYGMTYLYPIEGLEDCHVFGRETPDAGADPLDADAALIAKDLPRRERIRTTLEADAAIELAELQIPRRHKLHNLLPVDDPLAPRQWHLQNRGEGGSPLGNDIDIIPVWQQGLRGQGQLIHVMDGGVDYNHPDLLPNYLGQGKNINGGNPNDPKPTLSLDEDPSDSHGTPVAGLIVARANNDSGGAGVAPAAQFTVSRMLSGSTTDAEDATAFAFLRSTVDVINCSWGPADSSILALREIPNFTKAAILQNATSGRQNHGIIHVFSAGNDGDIGYRAHFNGFNNSPYVIPVGATTNEGVISYYSEPGANVFVTAPSSGGIHDIVTLDWRGSSGYTLGDYTADFGGTSASAPIVSGVVALMLQANPNLTWRDVQHILARSSTPTDLTFSTSTWQVNAAGFAHHYHYGFGRINAAAAIALAQTWVNVGPLVKVQRTSATQALTINVNQDLYLENVNVRVTGSSGLNWGDVVLTLVSPSGSRSEFFDYTEGDNLTFTSNIFPGRTVRHWGENARGNWTLEFRLRPGQTGSISAWTLDLQGTSAPLTNQAPTVPSPIELPTSHEWRYFDPLEGVTDPEGGHLQTVSAQGSAGTIVELLPTGWIRYRRPLDPSRPFGEVYAFIIDNQGGLSRRLYKFSLLTDDVTHVAHQAVAASETISFSWSGLASIDWPPGFLNTSYDGTIVSLTAPSSLSPGASRLPVETYSENSARYVTLLPTSAGQRVVDFVGRDSEIKTPAPDIGSTFTIEAHIRLDSYGQARGYGDADGDGEVDVVHDGGWGRIFDQGGVTFFVNNEGFPGRPDRSLVLYVPWGSGANQTTVGTSPASSLLPGKWYHVAASYQAGAPNPIRMYIDGAEVGVTYDNGSTTSAPPLDGDFWLVIGNSPSGTRPFDGQIAELRYWDSVRTLTQIATNRFELSAGQNPTRWLDLRHPLPATANWSHTEVDFLPRTGSFLQGREEMLLLEDFRDGDHFSPVYGPVNIDHFPLVLSEDWGFFRHHLSGPRRAWLSTSSSLGHLYTDQRFFPWVYSSTRSSWVYLIRGTGRPLWFYQPGQGWRTAN